jgi:3-oxoacyl-[acyl-carrier protein] reductase
MKSVLISNGDQIFNQKISDYLLTKNYEVLLLFQDEIKKNDYISQRDRTNNEALTAVSIHNNDREQLNCHINETFSNRGIDVLVHGCDYLDEAKLLNENSVDFGQYFSNVFKKLYLLNSVVTSQMIKKKKGNIIFPLIYDSLDNNYYPSSPIINQGKLSLMKSMCRELNAFKIKTNAITFGYYDNDFEPAQKRQLKKDFEIFALKPTFPQLDMMFYGLDILIESPEGVINGQTINMSPGIDFVL